MPIFRSEREPRSGQIRYISFSLSAATSQYTPSLYIYSYTTLERVSLLSKMEFSPHYYPSSHSQCRSSSIHIRQRGALRSILPRDNPRFTTQSTRAPLSDFIYSLALTRSLQLAIVYKKNWSPRPFLFFFSSFFSSSSSSHPPPVRSAEEENLTPPRVYIYIHIYIPYIYIVVVVVYCTGFPGEHVRGGRRAFKRDVARPDQRDLCIYIVGRAGRASSVEGHEGTSDVSWKTEIGARR